MHAPAAWAAQRESWRIVIQLNLIRSVNTILDLLTSISASSSPVRPLSPASYSSNLSPLDDGPFGNPNENAQFEVLVRMRLAPLRHVEADLQRLLGQAHEIHDHHDGGRKLREFFVRAGGLRHQPSTLRRGDSAAKATDVIAGCADDMKALWHNPAVRTTLAGSGVHLWQHAGL